MKNSLNSTQTANNTNQTQKSSKQPNNQYQTLIGLMGCFGGFLIELVIGSFYQWGIISIYVTSYFRSLDSSVTLQSTAIAFPLKMFSMGMTIYVGITLSQVTHPLIILGLTLTLASVMVFVSSFVQSFWLFIFLFGISFGLISGMNIMIPIVECNKYFPGRKMYVNGFILIGIGMGSLVFGLFSYNFLNPMKLSPNFGYYLGSIQLLDITNKVPQLIRWLSLLYLLISILGILFIVPVCMHNRQKENQQKQKLVLTNNQNREENKQIAVSKKLGQASSVTQTFCSKICWIQVILILLSTCGIFLINGNFKTYVKQTITDDEFLTIIGAIGSLGNGCSRFFWNLLFNKTGYKTVTLINLSICIIIFSTIKYTVNNKAAYFIEVFLANCCIGGHQVTIPTLSQLLYGQVIGSKVMGFFWNTVATANFIQFAYVQGLSTSIGFDKVIYICLGMCLLAIPVVLFTNFQGPWMNDTTSLEFLVSYEINKKKQKQKQQNIELNGNPNVKLSIQPIPQNEIKKETKKQKIELPPLKTFNNTQIIQQTSTTKMKIQN